MGRPWFGAKRYGLGWSPSSPTGWAVVGAYVVAVIACPWLLAALHAPRGLGLLLALGLTTGLIAVMSAKSDGRRWRWRWGGRD
jgi:hypothetical protein